MDIEERAEQWARIFRAENDASAYSVDQLLILAYLAGSAQTQADYVKHISAICDRHCLG